MKGVICSGGKGTRLRPLTEVVNKHLLPVYNLPMIGYPLFLLINSGIKEILIVTDSEYLADFKKLLGTGAGLGVKIKYAVQTEANGIAGAVLCAEEFAGDDSLAVVLGDNIFALDFQFEIPAKLNGAQLFLKKVENPEGFGVAALKANGEIVELIEKPQNFVSDQAVVGLYLYDNSLFDKIRKIEPSRRSELEITDVNLLYLKESKLLGKTLNCDWFDAGTIENLFLAGSYVRKFLTQTETQQFSDFALQFRAHQGLQSDNLKTDLQTNLKVLEKR